VDKKQTNKKTMEYIPMTEETDGFPCELTADL
jgi:hypothetical protein